MPVRCRASWLLTGGALASGARWPAARDGQASARRAAQRVILKAELGHSETLHPSEAAVLEERFQSGGRVKAPSP
jgi:hypothetical protein